MLAENGYVSEGVGNFSVSIVLVNVMDGLDRDVAVNLTVGGTYTCACDSTNSHVTIYDEQ